MNIKVHTKQETDLNILIQYIRFIAEHNRIINLYLVDITATILKFGNLPVMFSSRYPACYFLSFPTRCLEY